MQDVLTELKAQVLYITLNRVEKHNAFDDHLLLELQKILEAADDDPMVRLIVLKANGPSFCAGADLNWMQRMVEMNEVDNFQDAQILARLMHTLYHLSKPTLSLVQGAAFGGGAGLAAASDIVIASEKARFCFSEVKLGLIPAVISPYVIRAVGARIASWLFISAEILTAEKARELQLVHYVFPHEALLANAQSIINQLSKLPPEAQQLSKQLVREVADHPIDEALCDLTAKRIAKRRVSQEAQTHIRAFLNKS